MIIMQYVFLDGKFVEEKDAVVSCFDHGLLYGDGIFEGIRAYNGRVFHLEEHIDRLYAAAKVICLDIKYSKQEMIQIVIDSFKKNGLTEGYARLVVTRGKGTLGLSPYKCPKSTVFCIAAVILLYPEELYQTGMPIITSSLRRNNATIVDPQLKSLNYLNNVMGQIEAHNAGVSEALMLTTEGWVAECTGDNIFIIKDGEIFTPPTYIGTLDGITRRCVIRIARELGYTVNEVPFTLFNVYNADECFLTGTAAEVIAITSVDNRVIGSGSCGDVSAILRQAFHTYANSVEAGSEIK